MRLLITGADGQLGRCLQDHLRGTGHVVRACSRAELDITDPDSVKACLLSYRPDAVINAAAYTAVDRAEDDEASAAAVNAAAVGYLASGVNAIDATLVQVSTDYVFDGTGREPYREEQPVKPLGVYGRTKLAGERAAQSAHKHFIVRTAWVFSEYGHNFLKTIVRLGAERESLRVVSDQVGTPTYAGDLAAALVAILENPVPFGTYHFSGGPACSWYDFAGYIFTQASRVLPGYRSPRLEPIATADYPTPAQRPQYSVLSDDKLRACLKHPGGDWQAGVVSALTALGEDPPGGD